VPCTIADNPRGGAPVTTKKADPATKTTSYNRLRNNTCRLTQAPCATRARQHLPFCLAAFAPRTHFTPQYWLLYYLGL
jgi:hypothetical protein